MEKLTVKTPMGDLIAFPSEDPDNPGIHVSLLREGAAKLDLATVECRLPPEFPGGPCIQTHVWGDAGQEDATHDIDHAGVEDYFARTEQKKGE